MADKFTPEQAELFRKKGLLSEIETRTESDIVNYVGTDSSDWDIIQGISEATLVRDVEKDTDREEGPIDYSEGYKEFREYPLKDDNGPVDSISEPTDTDAYVEVYGYDKQFTDYKEEESDKSNWSEHSGYGDLSDVENITNNNVTRRINKLAADLENGTPEEVMLKPDYYNQLADTDEKKKFLKTSYDIENSIYEPVDWVTEGSAAEDGWNKVYYNAYEGKEYLVHAVATATLILNKQGWTALKLEEDEEIPQVVTFNSSDEYVDFIESAEYLSKIDDIMYWLKKEASYIGSKLLVPCKHGMYVATWNNQNAKYLIDFYSAEISEVTNSSPVIDFLGEQIDDFSVKSPDWFDNMYKAAEASPSISHHDTTEGGINKHIFGLKSSTEENVEEEEGINTFSFHDSRVEVLAEQTYKQVDELLYNDLLLNQTIIDENRRATKSEAVLQTNINKEEARAQTAELELDYALMAENKRAREEERRIEVRSTECFEICRLENGKPIIEVDKTNMNGTYETVYTAEQIEGLLRAKKILLLDGMPMVAYRNYDIDNEYNYSFVINRNDNTYLRTVQFEDYKLTFVDSPISTIELQGMSFDEVYELIYPGKHNSTIENKRSLQWGAFTYLGELCEIITCMDGLEIQVISIQGLRDYHNLEDPGSLSKTSLQVKYYFVPDPEYISIYKDYLQNSFFKQTDENGVEQIYYFHKPLVELSSREYDSNGIPIVSEVTHKLSVSQIYYTRVQNNYKFFQYNRKNKDFVQVEESTAYTLYKGGAVLDGTIVYDPYTIALVDLEFNPNPVKIIEQVQSYKTLKLIDEDGIYYDMVENQGDVVYFACVQNLMYKEVVLEIDYDLEQVDFSTKEIPLQENQLTTIIETSQYSSDFAGNDSIHYPTVKAVYDFVTNLYPLGLETLTESQYDPSTAWPIFNQIAPTPHKGIIYRIPEYVDSSDNIIPTKFFIFNEDTNEFNDITSVFGVGTGGGAGGILIVTPNQNGLITNSLSEIVTKYNNGFNIYIQNNGRFEAVLRISKESEIDYIYTETADETPKLILNKWKVRIEEPATSTDSYKYYLELDSDSKNAGTISINNEVEMKDWTYEELKAFFDQGGNLIYKGEKVVFIGQKDGDCTIITVGGNENGDLKISYYEYSIDTDGKIISNNAVTIKTVDNKPGKIITEEQIDDKIVDAMSILANGIVDVSNG